MFGTNNYYHPMDREYEGQIVENRESKKKSLFDVNTIGQSVIEGRGQGTFIQSVQAAIKRGAGRLELATAAEGSDQGVGVESYGKESREVLRELSRINEVKFTSVHTPANVIGNISGLGQNGFSDEGRKRTIDEINKAIDFSKDVTDGGAIVVHTGEFPRAISDAKWARDTRGEQLFEGFPEESDTAVMHIVDDRTGNIMQTVKKNQEVSRPVWNKFDPKINKKEWEKRGGKDYTDNNGKIVKPGDYIDYEGNKIEMTNRLPVFDTDPNSETYGSFKVVRQGWEDFQKEADERNKNTEKLKGRRLTDDEKITAEEAFFRAQLEIQEGQARGYALNYTRDFEKQVKTLKKLQDLKKHYEKIEAATNPEDRWRLEKEVGVNSRILPSESKMPTEIIEDEINGIQQQIKQAQAMGASQEQQAQEAKISQEHAKSIKKFALEKSYDSLAKTGLSAMSATIEEANRRKKKGDGEKMNPIFVAPENIFPEMGYGSHPEELIDLVKKSRERMVELLTKKKIQGSHWNIKEKKFDEIDNPNYNPKYANNKELAIKKAKDHIKATFDTQHLGMWKKHFKKRPGESTEQMDKRFKKWYLDQVKKMSDADILGHIHVVDGWGKGHTHLPAGQGGMPVVDAVTWLKENGYAGTMISEGYGEGPERNLGVTWRAFGANVYGGKDEFGFAMGAPQKWSEISQSYFGKTQSPYFIFGSYTPSNDWSLWSQTPME